MHRPYSCLRALAQSMLLLLLSLTVCSAHDIPGKATLLVFVKADQARLHVLMRVPMEALSEVKFPLRGPGYIDIPSADPALVDAVHIYLLEGLRFSADGALLPKGELEKVRIALPGDKALTDFNAAFASVERPRLADGEEIYWKQAALDVLLTFPLTTPQAKIAIDANLARLAMETHTVLRFVNDSGEERTLTYQGYPGRVELDPNWWHAASHFVALGFWHILDGIDHLLFLLCLVIPTRSVKALIPAVTAFTVAHSITLISSALDLIPTAAWFGPLIETLIALSVCYMAIENVLGIQFRKRWAIVFCFGLIHGFGFSFILADRMQFAGEHLVSALVAFNVGVELGQLLVLIIAVPILRWLVLALSRIPNVELSGERLAAVILSVLVAHTAWHWLTERGAQLLEFSWGAPTFDTAFFVAAMRWGMLLIGSVGVLWAMDEIFKRWSFRAAQT